MIKLELGISWRILVRFSKLDKNGGRMRSLGVLISRDFGLWYGKFVYKWGGRDGV